MLTMTLDKLPFIDIIDNVEIHSFDASIYTVRLYIDGLEYRLVENNHKPYQRRSAQQIKKDLKKSNVHNVELVHSSAYDEMVGQPVFSGEFSGEGSGNEIRVPLSID